MYLSKLVAGALALLLAAIWVWVVTTTENPLRDAREAGRIAMQERLSGPAATDPLVLFASSLTELHAATPTNHGITYVPAYSRIRVGTGRGFVELATTLSIHNSSHDTPIVLKRVTYHSTEGELVQSYLGRSVGLRPLGTIEIFVPRDDLRGGTGANFVVEWASVSAVSDPTIEAIMIGTVGTTSYSFVSQGRSLRAVATN